MTQGVAMNSGYLGVFPSLSYIQKYFNTAANAGNYADAYNASAYPTRYISDGVNWNALVTQDPTGDFLGSGGVLAMKSTQLASVVTDGVAAQTSTLMAVGGSQANPLGGSISSLIFGKFGLPAPGYIKIPANTVPSSTNIGYGVVEVVATVKKGGTTATANATLWIGPTNSSGDTTLANPGFAATDTTAKITWHVWLSGNTVDSHAVSWKDNVGGTSSIQTGGAWNPAVDNYVSIGTNNLSASDTLSLIGLEVKLHINPVGAAVSNMVTTPITVPVSFFGLVSQDWPTRTGSSGGLAPTFPIGRLSNYDNNSTHWTQLQSAANTISWTSIDAFVSGAKAQGAVHGVYILYGTPTFLASTGAAVAAPYGGLGGGAYPSLGDPTLSQLTYFCTQFALRNKNVYGGFFDRISLWNEPDFTQTPSGSTFWWGTPTQFVDMLYTAYTAFKTADPTLKIMSPGTFSIINSNTGLNQWISVAGTLNPTKYGYNTFDEFAAHPYHARPFGYSGNGDILGLQLGGILAVQNALLGTPAYGRPYGVTEYGVSSGAGAELTAFLAASTSFRETFVQRLWIDAMLEGVEFMSAFSLGNVSNLMGNLSTDDPGSISGLRKVYNACAGKTIVAPSGIAPSGARFLTFSDGTTYTV